MFNKVAVSLENTPCLPSHCSADSAAQVKQAGVSNLPPLDVTVSQWSQNLPPSSALAQAAESLKYLGGGAAPWPPLP